MNIQLEITDTIPDDIEEGILYVSLKHWITAHKCGCGCGQKVVLRLSPKHWAITLNGESVSMYPSVGNWQLPCKSHYWIEEGQILLARDWSDEEIAGNRTLTKGMRTPYQTPYSRFKKAKQFDGRSDGEMPQVGARLENELEKSSENPKKGCSELPLKSANVIRKGAYSQWWQTSKATMRKQWQMVLDLVGNNHVA